MYLIIIFISLIILGVYITLWIVARKHPDSTIGKFFSRLQEAMEEHYIKKSEEKEKIRADYEKRKAQKREAKAKHPWFYMFKNLMIFILVVGLVFGLPIFAYKKNRARLYRNLCERPLHIRLRRRIVYARHILPGVPDWERKRICLGSSSCHCIGFSFKIRN